MWTNPQKTVDLVTYTEEILNGKLHFLRSAKEEEENKKDGLLLSCTWKKPQIEKNINLD